jgi:hypothetical protein
VFRITTFFPTPFHLIVESLHPHLLFQQTE